MRGFLILLTILLAVLGIGYSAVANADDQTFLDAARAAGYVNNDQEILRNGYAACALRGETGDNDTVSKAIALALRFLGHDTTDQQSAQFVNIATTYLCPQVVTKP